MDFATLFNCHRFGHILQKLFSIIEMIVFPRILKYENSAKITIVSILVYAILPKRG